MFGRKIHFSPVSRKRRKSLQNSDKMQRLSCVSKMLLTLYSWVPALALLHFYKIKKAKNAGDAHKAGIFEHL
jgi:hypothetical protein